VKSKECVAAATPLYAAPRAQTRRIVAIVLAILLAACAAQPPASDVEKIDRVLMLIHQRLGYMDDVARNKWNSGAPIEDLPRERAIIDEIGAQAAGYGLDPAFARDFFRAQIEASKTIQRARFAEWRAKKQPPFTNVVDLRDRIRPALDALTPELMKALAAALPGLRASGEEALVRQRVIVFAANDSNDIAALETAVAPLLAYPQSR
jgi:chorismate mutase